jgi:hypothetical protein
MRPDCVSLEKIGDGRLRAQRTRQQISVSSHASSGPDFQAMNAKPILPKELPKAPKE